VSIYKTISKHALASEVPVEYDEDGLGDSSHAESDVRSSSTTHFTELQSIHSPPVSPSEGKSRALAAVGRLVNLANTNPAMTLPSFHTTGLHALAFWYSRFEPI